VLDVRERPHACALPALAIPRRAGDLNTTLNDFRLQVFPGDGLVGRFADAVVIILTESAPQAAIAENLLALVRESPSGGGRRLVRQVIGLTANAEPGDVPSFCVVAGSELGLAVLLQGSLELSLSRAEGEERVSGEGVITWVERLVEPPFDGMTVMPTRSTPPPPNSMLDLRGGVVPGSGFGVEGNAGGSEEARDGVRSQSSLEPDALLPPPEPDETLFEPAVRTSMEREDPISVPEFESISLIDVSPEESREPVPVDAGEAADAAGAEGVVVPGVLCKNGHFNNPVSAFCSVCGISMVQLTHNPVDGVRPPLGYVVVDDGATYSLDTNYIIGREPDYDPEVAAGRARPLNLPDPERTISRSHADLTLENWDVKVTDRHSTNGTYIAYPDDDGWTRLPPDEPTVIRPGAHLMIGRRTLVFDSHHRT
jgi:hypothetical protein